MPQEDFQFMVEGMISDLVQILMDRKGLSLLALFVFASLAFYLQNQEQ